jgi:hypothetical protein
MDADIDPEALARKLGVLKEGEEVNRTRAEKLGRNDNRSGLLIYVSPRRGLIRWQRFHSCNKSTPRGSGGPDSIIDGATTELLRRREMTRCAKVGKSRNEHTPATYSQSLL